MKCDRDNPDIKDCHAYSNGECMNGVSCGGIMAHSPINTIDKIFGTGQQPEEVIKAFYSGKYDDMSIKEFREMFPQESE